MREVDRYISIAEQEYLQLDIPQRLGKLTRKYVEQGQQLTESQQRNFNGLHRQMYTARRHAEKNCRKLRMGGVPYSPTSQALRNQIALWDMLLQVSKGLKVSPKRIRRLVKKTGEKDCWQLSEEELTAKRKEARATYKEFKN